MSSWHMWWMLGALPFIVLIYLGTRTVWYSHGPAPEGSGSNGTFRTVYVDPFRSKVAFLLGLFAFYLAVYIVSSAALKAISPGEILFHLAFWALAPPSWFFFEWFVWFDNHSSTDAVQALRVGQDLASKFWAGVLGLIVSLKIAEGLGPVVSK